MTDNFFTTDEKLLKLDKETMEKCKAPFEKTEEIALYNVRKVLSAFIRNKVSERHLGISTGYGYNDEGRDTLEKVFAECMGAESSLIRHSFASGTHTITVMLFGILRPGDTLLCVTGRPYDTLIDVLGIDKFSDGSLKDFGVNYEQLDLTQDGRIDLEAVKKKLSEKKYKMVYIQRSRGYSLRPSLSVDEIGKTVQAVKSISPDTAVAVDNCYGEFTETKEPCDVGADVIAGSLIKNAGGGIAPSGGYIAGKKEYVEKCAYRLTCPGVGGEIGATLGHNRELFMGLFSAPKVVSEALKTAIYSAALMERLGFSVTPLFDEERHDIIEAITLGDSEKLIAFCRGIQSASPVDAFALPEPWDMPGYDDKIIMAAGAFTLGSSIELSADAPLREPFAVWMQGGLNFESGRTAVLSAAEQMYEKGLLTV